MSDVFTPDLEQFVAAEIASGRHSSREEVIVEALRLLQRDRQEAIEGIRLGLEDWAAGRVKPLETAFAELRNDRRASQR